MTVEKKRLEDTNLDLDVYLKYKDLFKHLNFNTNTGWGWLPPNDQILEPIQYIRDHINPKKMLEIGYYRGHSTSYFAEFLPECEIISCCPPHNKWKDSHKAVQEAYNGRVEVMGVESPHVISMLPDIEHTDWDFGFIDGGHAVEEAFTDVMIAIRQNIPWLLFDNARHRGVEMALNWFKKYGILEETKTWNYDGLCKGVVTKNDLTLCKVTADKLLDM